MNNNMNGHDFDIAIIGGGPAGTTTAIHLAKAGLNVCLFEKKTFPRDVLCGEFLSTEVIKSLKKLGLIDKFLSQNPNRINSFRFINDDSSELETHFPFEAYSLKRSIFDNFLFNEAEAAGTKIFQPVEVKKIENMGAYFQLSIQTPENIIEEISTGFVIAAYGKQNIFDKILKRDFANVRSQLNGIKFYIDKKYLPSFPENEIRIYASEGIYCGINSVNENEITLCILEDKSTLSNSSRYHLIHLLERNKKFENLFDLNLISLINDLRVFGTGNIFFGRKELIKNGMFMVGDAAGVIAPLAGDGIGMAMETAELLSNILINGFRNKTMPKYLESQYFISWNNHFNLRLLSAGLLQKLLLTNKLRKAGTGLIKIFPSILPRIIQLTRG